MQVELRKKFDKITDTLWAGGVTNPVTYIEQISYLLYLKLLDEEENNRRILERLTNAAGNAVSLFPDQAERYRWQNWRFKSGVPLRDYLRDEVFPYMASLVKEDPHVAEYFKDANLEIVDPNVLKRVVDEIDTLELQKLGPDVKGDIFEHLLTHLGQSALNGQFRTPKQIRSLMVQMLDPDLGDSIYDPVCGTGGFLIDALDHVLAKYSTSPREVPVYGEDWLDRNDLTISDAKTKLPNLQTYRRGNGELVPQWSALERSLFGIDVSKAMMRITMMNLVLRGVANANVKRANSLSELGGLTEQDLTRKYSVILSNPPFAGVLPKDSIRADLPTNSTKSELLFLALMMQALAPGGRCAVIVPEGLLFSETKSHVELRGRLINEFDLLAVVSLPAGVFKPYSGVKTAVLVFRRPSLAQRSTINNVWFYEVRNDGFDPDRMTGGGRPETPEKNDIPELLMLWSEYKGSRFERAPGVGAEALLAPGSALPSCWYASKATIEQNENNLSAGRYRPNISESISVDESTQLLSRLIAIEEEIGKDLAALQTALELKVKRARSK